MVRADTRSERVRNSRRVIRGGTRKDLNASQTSFLDEQIEPRRLVPRDLDLQLEKLKSAGS